MQSCSKSQNLHRFPVFGRTIIKVPTSTQTLDIKKTTEVDRNGNPIVVAGVVTFVLSDTIKAAFGMQSLRSSFMFATNTAFRCTQLPRVYQPASVRCPETRVVRTSSKRPCLIEYLLNFYTVRCTPMNARPASPFNQKPERYSEQWFLSYRRKQMFVVPPSSGLSSP